MFRAVFPSIIRSSRLLHTATGICQADTATCLLAGKSSNSFPLASRQQYLFDIYLLLWMLKKLQVARRGLYSTAALCIADCALASNDVVPSFISRGGTITSGAGALY
jgi:hypothetical protein